VRTECEEKIALVASWAARHPGDRLVLHGFVDERERLAGDNALAAARAAAVRAALIGRGVAPGRIDLAGGDAPEAVCRERTERCRELSRRVEVRLAQGGAP
jgi:outer membrane protein OmpA-like peptidoglycan-associated protein